VTFIWLWRGGYLLPLRIDAYTAFDNVMAIPAVWRWIAIGSLALAAIVRLPSLALLVIAALAIYWSRGLEPFSTPEQLAKATDYFAVQRWAKENTKRGSLFLVDPTHVYGWREESERPSFGNVHEWLYSGWIYTSDRKVLGEGIRRLEEFGLRLDDYLAREEKLRGSGHAALYEDLRKAYYAQSDAWFIRIGRTYGVTYFVLDKSSDRANRRLPIVYENPHYRVTTIK
jgi:hypothetical protein